MLGLTRALNQFFDATLDLSSSGDRKQGSVISISWPKLQLLVATCDSTVTWAALPPLPKLRPQMSHSCEAWEH